MSRPTIALAMIVKNERKNLERLFESVHGCFDEIHITDTGSTDGTLEWLMERGQEAAGAKVLVHHFKWVDNFAAARNASFAPVKTDFVMWLDGDDALFNKEGFIKWRDHAMEFCDFALATYDYALEKETGRPMISFVRERVFKTDKKPVWKYRIHEGIVPEKGWRAAYATTWKVQHHRDDEDVKADRSRNLRIVESLPKEEMDARMTYYYAKELFEAGQHEKSITVFTNAAVMPELELHDRIMALQYAAYAALFSAEKLKPEYAGEKWMLAVQLCQQGLILEPTRAEFYCIIGDAYCKMGKLKEALPYFSAAESCIKAATGPYAEAIYKFDHCYSELPKINKAKIYFNLGDLDRAQEEAQKAWIMHGANEAKAMLDEMAKIRPLVQVDGERTETTDIVFTCPPQNAYPFDEVIYEKKGMGGSETALIEMARLLKQKRPDRRVIVFNPRESELVAPSGVEYLPATQVNEYFSKLKPAVNIAWRHNIKLTHAKTYLWCHDLVTQGVEYAQNFDKMLCLTPFHKDYVMACQGVPEEKIVVTRNGLNPKKFKHIDLSKITKNPNKILWMSSPDRGLERAMRVIDRLKLKPEFKDLELHVYYGLENLYKYGLGELADKLKAMMAQRQWVKYHGFTEQSKMYEQVADGVVWLHPCDFIETSCITAVEMLTLGVFPVTRRLGGLKDTLRKAESEGMAVMLDHDCVTDNEHAAYAEALENALKERKWERVKFDPESVSWSGVADQWIEEMKL